MIINPLKVWVQNILPVVYDDSLSYLEIVAKINAKTNEIITQTNENTHAIETLSEVIAELGDIDELKELLDEVKTVIENLYTTDLPLMNGTASAGSADHAARSDHVHPSDTSKASINAVKNVDNKVKTFTKPNLLDNWYFLTPVNSRGLTSWQNPGYTIDRWELSSGNAEINSSGLMLNGTLIQKIEKAIGVPFVCSALLSNGQLITPTYDDTTKIYTLTATGQTIIAAKLEVGTEQTLAHNIGTDANPAWSLNSVAKYQEELVNSIGSTADSNDNIANYNYEKVVSTQQYRPGDTIITTVYGTGYFTSGAKSMRIPVYLPKFLPDNITAQQISIIGCNGTARISAGGYVENFSSEHDWVADTDYTVGIAYYDPNSKVINIKIDKATTYISGETTIPNNSIMFFLGSVQFSVPNS